MICPECKSENTTLAGYEDGGGDYGDGFTEIWYCDDCGNHFDGYNFDTWEELNRLHSLDDLLDDGDEIK